MDFEVLDLGLIHYKEAWEIQKEVFSRVRAGLACSALIICRHYPVITLGRRADKNNILAGADELRAAGVQIYEAERGGDVTYHGPGQITIYPIFKLQFFKKDLHWFLRRLEEVIISYLSDYGINAGRRNGFTGVWVNDEKIASIGISIRNWISFHGVSLNVKKDDLQGYSFIRPCGLEAKMTSLETVLGREIELAAAEKALLPKFSAVFLTNREPFLETIGDLVPQEANND